MLWFLHHREDSGRLAFVVAALRSPCSLEVK
jgi:hypothetical protein